MDLATRAIQNSELRRAEPLDTPKVGGASGAGSAAGTDFGGQLLEAMAQARSHEKGAEEAATKFAAGDPNVGIHEVVIAAEKAQVAVRYAVTLKNRMIEAYKELMNTSI